MHLASVALRTTARCVSTKPDAAIFYEDFLISSLVGEVGVEIIYIMREFIISLKELVPFVCSNMNRDFRYEGLIPHVSDAFVIHVSSGECPCRISCCRDIALSSVPLSSVPRFLVASLVGSRSLARLFCLSAIGCDCFRFTSAECQHDAG